MVQSADFTVKTWKMKKSSRAQSELWLEFKTVRQREHLTTDLASNGTWSMSVQRTQPSAGWIWSYRGTVSLNLDQIVIYGSNTETDRWMNRQIGRADSQVQGSQPTGWLIGRQARRWGERDRFRASVWLSEHWLHSQMLSLWLRKIHWHK